MKTITKSLLATALSMSAFLINNSNAEPNRTLYSFDCTCKVGACEALENLDITIFSDQTIEASIGNTDWEFNESLTAARSDQPTPNAFSGRYTRYTVTSSRDYLPLFYKKGDLLLSNELLTGGRRINGIKEVSYVGSVIVITQKGKQSLQFGCTRN